MKKLLKFPQIIISWAVAITVAFIFVKMIIVAIANKFNNDVIPMLIIPVFILAIPIYIIIRKTLLK